MEFSGLHLWDVVKEGEGFKLQFAADPTDYLKRELLVTLEQKRELSTVNAIADPQKFMVERNNRIDKYIKDYVSKSFASAVKEFNDVGLPSETVKRLSMARANRVLEDWLEVEEYQFPGYKSAIRGINLERELMQQGKGAKNKDAVTVQKAEAVYKPEAK